MTLTMYHRQLTVCTVPGRQFKLVLKCVFDLASGSEDGSEEREAKRARQASPPSLSAEEEAEKKRCVHVRHCTLHQVTTSSCRRQSTGRCMGGVPIITLLSSAARRKSQRNGED